MAKKKGIPLNGWLCLDKPYGISSNNALQIVKRILNPQKIGHSGTLDPLASGILPIALGEATKTVAYAMDNEKTYVFTITFGEERSTGDAEGEVIATSKVIPNKDDVASVLAGFTGKITQTPPKFSALKINGKRAYDLARNNEDFELPQREVLIKSLEIIASTEENSNQITLKTTCGKGTYVRSLAMDIAEKLGSKGYVSYLRRTKVGFFCEKNAILLDKIETLGHIASVEEFLLPVETALTDISALALSDEEALDLKKGKAVVCKAANFENLTQNEIAYALNQDKLVAIVRKNDNFVVPIRVMNY
ncbi:MAG: tRNA pseudouridine(55) synthase TruB [Alphaproteobacteria bacterium]